MSTWYGIHDNVNSKPDPNNDHRPASLSLPQEHNNVSCLTRLQRFNPFHRTRSILIIHRSWEDTLQSPRAKTCTKHHQTCKHLFKYASKQRETCFLLCIPFETSSEYCSIVHKQRSIVYCIYVFIVALPGLSSSKRIDTIWFLGGHVQRL